MIFRTCAFIGLMMWIGPQYAFASKVTKEQVIENYADNVYRSYRESLLRVQDLKRAIDTFLASPSPEAFEVAKRRWLDARYVYGQTEVYRFYQGPIDDPKTGLEGGINAWPLDEAYIDYVEGAEQSGLIQDEKVELTKAKLRSFNEGGSGDVLKMGQSFDPEKAIATGYHAIEFLLWGQDRNPNGPGHRSWKDYLTGSEATAKHGERRATYLLLVTEMLEEDLKTLVTAWQSGQPANYRAAFLKMKPEAALAKILSGMGILAKGELAGERIDVALDTLDQEDEHSCFSDNTHNDIYANALGIHNVFYGDFGIYQGPGISDLLSEKDRQEYGELLTAALESVQAIPQPFDQTISKKNTEAWKKAQNAVRKLFMLGDGTVKLGKTLGLGNISADLPG